jgi:hypothetical protein
MLPLMSQMSVRGRMRVVLRHQRQSRASPPVASERRTMVRSARREPLLESRGRRLGRRGRRGRSAAIMIFASRDSLTVNSAKSAARISSVLEADRRMGESAESRVGASLPGDPRRFSADPPIRRSACLRRGSRPDAPPSTVLRRKKRSKALS